MRAGEARRGGSARRVRTRNGRTREVRGGGGGGRGQTHYRLRLLVRERCRKSKRLSASAKAKHRKSLKRAGTFDVVRCGALRRGVAWCGSWFSSGTACRRCEDTPLRSLRPISAEPERELEKEFVRTLPSTRRFRSAERQLLLGLIYSPANSSSVSYLSIRIAARCGFISEYGPAIYISLDCLSGKRRRATKPLVNIKQRHCIGTVRIRFDVLPPPASVSSSSFMAAIGHLSYRRLFLRLIY